MNLLNKLTIKNLKLNKKRTIVIIVGIMLSVALITAVATMYASGISSLINFEKSKEGNYHFVFYDVPVEDIKDFENNRSIEDFMITGEVGYARLAESKNEYKPYAYITAFTKSAMENLSVNLVEGRFPENENEILITTHLRTNGRVKLNVGETITLEVGTRTGIDNQRLGQDILFSSDEDERITDTVAKTYTIVGRIERPAENIESYEAPGYTFITYTDGTNLTGNVNIYARYTESGLKNRYKVTANLLDVDADIFEEFYTDDSYDEERVDRYFEEISKARYESDMNEYLILLETEPLSENTIGDLSIVVVIVCIIIVFTSIFCIKNSFDISITEKIKQYGMLASIGATKKQIKRNVFYEAFILGMIGIPLGLCVGFLASYILIIISNYYFTEGVGVIKDVYLQFDFSWIATLFSVIAGIITIYLSAIRSAGKASKISPVTAIRNSGDIKLKRSSIRSLGIIRKIFGIGGDISYKNIKRNRKKYRTTVISIIVSVFVFIALSSFMNLAYKEFKSNFATSEYNLNLSVYSRIYEDELFPQIDNLMTGLEHIEKYGVIDDIGVRHEKPLYDEEYLKAMFEVSYFRYGDEYESFGYEEDENQEYADSMYEDSRDTELDEERRYNMFLSELEHSYIEIYSVGEASYREYVKKLGLNYNDVKDKFILVNNQVIGRFNEKTKNYEEISYPVYQYKKGDTLFLEYENYIDEDEMYNETEENVEYIDFSNNIAYVTREYPFGLGDIGNPCLVISDEYFKTLKDDLKAYSLSDSIKEIYFLSDNAMLLQENIENILDEYDYEYSINNVDEEVRTMQNFYTLVAIFLYGFITVISFIGITNIFNTITTGMELRKQEFAMLKSIGMTKREFSRMIRLESIFMGTKSLVFGTMIGLIISYVIYYILEPEFEYQLPLKAVGMAVIAVFLLITVIMRYSISKINKQNTIETIRNENI